MSSNKINKRQARGIPLFLFLAVVSIVGSGKVWADAAATPAPTAAVTPAADATSLKGFMNYADFTWVNGNTHETDFPMAGKVFSPELLLDTNYAYQFTRPNDHMINGSTAMAMDNEVEVEHVGFGGDFNVDNVHARLMTEYGMYANQVPRNDETPARGTWNIMEGTMYLTEAYGGVHIDIPGTNGMNIEMGQFPSYVGLFSFYNSENWCYQASYVSSNTPWFFTGMRIQFFPSDALKIEPWIINGWQTYGAFDEGLGGTGMNYGAEIRWAPNPALVVISNNYVGPDTADSPNCIRYHTDDSVVVKYLENPKSSGISKMAFSITADGGFQQGPMFMGAGTAGTLAADGQVIGPGGFLNVGPTGPNEESFLGAMAYDRTWFDNDHWAFTFGGGAMENTGRYLALLPSINGDSAQNYTADSNANAAFTTGPGLPWVAWDYDFGFQYMPNQYLTFDLEYTHRWSSENYFNGPGGETSSDGWTAGAGTSSAQVSTGAYKPNLVQFEDIIVGSIMVHI
jgi:hypothetical protein